MQENTLEYLLESPILKYFWTKHDFYMILHFISNYDKIWEFTLPVLMQSHLAKRWFYSENELNKADVFYRL